MVKKNKKMLLRIIIIALALIVACAIVNKSYGVAIIGVVGIGIIFVYALQVLVVDIGLIVHGLISGFLGSGTGTAVSGLKVIFFNHSTLTTAAYFASDSSEGSRLGLPADGVWTEGVMFNISQKVTQYYYILRNLSIAVLLFVLLYIAIRMAMSTISADEAKYKKMLTNWAVSLALVFVLHYIMIITFFVSNTLVGILEQTITQQSITGDTTLDYAALIGNALIPFTGFGEAIIFLMLIGMEITFLFMYIKRVIVLGFLILIAPLITITYSIDKIGDGKSQALNNWLKEFIYNVIIQPFHCLLYITLINTVIVSMAGHEGFGGFIIYIIVLQFVKEAEEIIKKIFNIQAGSMPGMKSMGALALGAMTALGGAAKGAGAISKAKKMPKMTEEAGKGVKEVAEKTGDAKNTKPDLAKTNNSATDTNAAAKAAQEAGKDKYNSKLTADQIDELKAEGIMPGDQEYDSYSANHGIKPGETGPDSSADAEDITPPQRPAVVEAQEGAERSNFADAPIQTVDKKSFARQIRDGAVGAEKFFGGPDVTARDGIKAAAKLGATVAAAGIGLGMGDMKSAVGLGMTAYGLSDRIDNAIDSHKNNLQLEKNEEIYDQRYEEYVEQYKKLVNPDATEDQIRDELTTLFEKYDDGSLNYDSIKNEQERELKRSFLKDSYSELRKSYEATGGEKPGDLAKAYTVNKASAKYREKHYRA